MRHGILRWAALHLLIALGAGLSGAAASSATAPAPTLAARQLAALILATGNHAQQPFAIVDKRAALLTLFSAEGHLLASSSVLLGSVVGDHSVPGVGDRAQSGQLRPGDATTPAGRFRSAPGHNHTGESVIWVDPDTAFAIHRLRPGRAHADRARRLAARDPARKRVSAGCIVVPVAFYESFVQPLLGRQEGVVYVLPERSDAAHADLPFTAEQWRTL